MTAFVRTFVRCVCRDPSVLGAIRAGVSLDTPLDILLVRDRFKMLSCWFGWVSTGAVLSNRLGLDGTGIMQFEPTDPLG